MNSFVRPSSKSQSTQSTASNTILEISSSSPSSAAATPSSGWTSLGCDDDSAGARTLTNPQYGNNNVTAVELCQSQCKATGVIRAGVEYAGERCYDNAFQNYRVPVTDGCNYSSSSSATSSSSTVSSSSSFRMFTVSKSQCPSSSTSNTVKPTSSSIKTIYSMVKSPSIIKATSSSVKTTSNTSKSTSTTSWRISNAPRGV
jgi:hypothetical protein